MNSGFNKPDSGLRHAWPAEEDDPKSSILAVLAQLIPLEYAQVALECHQKSIHQIRARARDSCRCPRRILNYTRISITAYECN